MVVEEVRSYFSVSIKRRIGYRCGVFLGQINRIARSVNVRIYKNDRYFIHFLARLTQLAHTMLAQTVTGLIHRAIQGQRSLGNMYAHYRYFGICDCYRIWFECGQSSRLH
jgi:hypothetical protein